MRYKGKKRLVLVKMGLGLIAGLLLSKLTSHTINHRVSVFSWYGGQLQQPNETFIELEKYDIDTIFQFISHKDSQEHLEFFLETASRYEKDVYFLTGEPEWALEEYADELVKVIQRVGYFRESSKYESALKGVVVDVEPYLLEEFKSNPQQVMKDYVVSMISAYQAAQYYDLDMIVCIPYYFDTMGFSDELEIIIREASDSVAVMNYYRDKEVEHLQTEARLSSKYHKPIITIYELQPPGEHDLSDKNTYYHQGIRAVYNNFNQTKRAFKQQDIFLSFHEFRYFKALNERKATEYKDDVK